ncbi:MAG: hypothetical protein AABZ15_03490 [Nitrospirota bacterium]
MQTYKIMGEHKTKERPGHSTPVSKVPQKKGISAFLSRGLLHVDHPSLIHFSSTPLFRLETSPEKYAHLLKNKDAVQIGPIVNYFIGNSGHVAYLGGDVVKNLYLRGRKKYKAINILAILTTADIDKYSCIMNNIISANDGAFSLGLKYLVKKNRCEGCFREIALARYVIEPRLEGPEKLLYPFRPASIELDLTTQEKFSDAFGLEVRT